MADARQTAAAEKLRALKKQADAIARVADIEDKQRREDEGARKKRTEVKHRKDERRLTPPVSQLGTPFKLLRRDSRAKYELPGEAVNEEPDGAGDSGGDGDLEDEDEDEQPEDEPPKKKKKSIKPTRQDVAAVRETVDRSGTPVTADGVKRKDPDDIDDRAHKKTKALKKSGLAKASKSSASTATSRCSVVETPEDDSMARYGGPALDDDDSEIVEHPKNRKSKYGMPAKDGLVKVVPVLKPLTKKAQRGDSRKWKLSHLPEGTAERFTNDVVPLMRERLGTLKPWEGLTVEQVQLIVDRVYGAGTHEVTAAGAWFGLVAYRSTDYRSGFVAQAQKAMEMLVSSQQGEDSDAADSDADVEVDNDSDADDTGASSKKFDFKTPDGVARFVKWAVTKPQDSDAKPQDKHTSPLHWKQWGDGEDKKGFLCSFLILYTFAHHLDTVNLIPLQYDRLEERACGALLLAMQAVEHTLGMWTSGECKTEKGRGAQFSADNWGDVRERRQDKKIHITPRATRFWKQIKERWSDERWGEVLSGAKEWMENKSWLGRATPSAASSDAGDLEEVMDEDVDLVVISD
ncbi:hypothetical protein GGX14DRAFT_576630 [Mycena pura]|uniref:Uncharacterized protein n=1 Tax=Mycena pura TaxID=153505 RepID=A0AAD6Y713_9AGAR|nr:hypothetical protein GGX14DRAFT_576630 [Mycena pura]